MVMILEENSNNEYVFDRLLEITLKSIEDMNKYNSVVCSIGYISLLAILSYTHKFIIDIFLILICIFYILSVSIFVIFEMKKIFLNNSYHYKVMENLEKHRLGNFDKKTLIAENNNAYLDCYKKFQEQQKNYFIPSAFLGFGAGVLLVLNFVPALIKILLKYLCSCCN